MEFNKWYYYWFENNGFCPFCGKYMIVSIGCHNKDCPMVKKTMKEDEFIKRKVINIYQRKTLLKRKNERLRNCSERKEQNLDTSSKKHYLEDDNQGISE